MPGHTERTESAWRNLHPLLGYGDATTWAGINIATRESMGLKLWLVGHQNRAGVTHPDGTQIPLVHLVRKNWGAPDMSKAEDYQEHADECERMAAEDVDPTNHDILRRLAQQWRSMISWQELRIKRPAPTGRTSKREDRA
jgi:hypothetical protein